MSQSRAVWWMHSGVSPHEGEAAEPVPSLADDSVPQASGRVAQAVEPVSLIGLLWHLLPGSHLGGQIYPDGRVACPQPVWGRGCPAYSSALAVWSCLWSPLCLCA